MSPLRFLTVKAIDLVVELAGLLRGFGLVLRGDGEFVLLLAGDLPLLGDVLGGLAHVVAVERIPQAVADHRVDIHDIAHLVAGAQVGGMGAEGHVFLATGGDDRRHRPAGCAARPSATVRRPEPQT